jgi:hypothetical protein
MERFVQLDCTASVAQRSRRRAYPAQVSIALPAVEKQPASPVHLEDLEQVEASSPLAIRAKPGTRALMVRIPAAQPASIRKRKVAAARRAPPGASVWQHRQRATTALQALCAQQMAPRLRVPVEGTASPGGWLVQTALLDTCARPRAQQFLRQVLAPLESTACLAGRPVRTARQATRVRWRRRAPQVQFFAPQGCTVWWEQRRAHLVLPGSSVSLPAPRFASVARPASTRRVQASRVQIAPKALCPQAVAPVTARRALLEQCPHPLACQSAPRV